MVNITQAALQNDPIEPKIVTPVDMRNARRTRYSTFPGWSDAAKADILARITGGDLPVELAMERGYPSLAALRAERSRDPAFDEDMVRALEACADVMLQEAAEYARNTTASDNPIESRKSEVYIKAVALAVEKLAPRTHGPLLKMAGADGGPITVMAVKYAVDDAKRADEVTQKAVSGS